VIVYILFASIINGFFVFIDKLILLTVIAHLFQCANSTVLSFDVFQVKVSDYSIPITLRNFVRFCLLVNSADISTFDESNRKTL